MRETRTASPSRLRLSVALFTASMVGGGILATSPLSIRAFFDGPVLSILMNELVWVWIPVVAGAALVASVRRRRGGTRVAEGAGTDRV